MARLQRMWRRHPFLVAAFVLALLMAVGLSGRAVFLARQFDLHHTQAVAGWMTPRFIMRVYGLDPGALAAPLAVPEGSNPNRALDRIARDQGRPVADLIRAVEAAIAGVPDPAKVAP